MIAADINNGQAGCDAVWIQLIKKKNMFFFHYMLKNRGAGGIFHWFEGISYFEDEDNLNYVFIYI